MSPRHNHASAAADLSPTPDSTPPDSCDEPVEVTELKLEAKKLEASGERMTALRRRLRAIGRAAGMEAMDTGRFQVVRIDTDDKQPA